MSYQKLAKEILDGVGGKENVNAVWHCATRLRFKLNDVKSADTNKIEKLEGVITVVDSAGQYQVVVGNSVSQVYGALTSLPGMATHASTSNEDVQEKRTGKFNPISQLMDFVSAVFTPFLGALAGAGILKGILALLTTMNWISPDSGAYKVWSTAGDAIFYFLPVFLAFTAAKKLRVNQFVAVSLAGALVHPTLVEIVSNSQTINFFGISIVPITYTASVFPILLAIWGLSYLEPLLNKFFPESVRNMLTPLFSLVIMLPLTLIMIGPIGTKISSVLALVLLAIYSFSPLLAGLVLGAFHQSIVIFGVHWALITLMINNITNQGYDQWLPIICAAVLSQAGAALGVFLKSKDAKIKGLSSSAAITAIFGITEPAIYGVTLKLKRPFYCAMIAGGIGGAIIGSFEVHASTFTFPSLLAIPTYLGQGFIGEVIGLIVAFFGAVILTYFFGVSTKSVGSISNDVSNPNEILSPIDGEVVPLNRVSDEVFASEAMGKGAGIIPADGIVTAPVNGTVTSVYRTGHAIGIVSDSGVELLIHIGINTVKLKGQYFKPLVKENEKIKVGDRLVEFDLEQIKAAGYDPTVMVVITNSSNYDQVIVNLEDAKSKRLLQLIPAEQ
ncbi:PTS glucose transporter subunit IIA [Paenibacillus albidus]|uniref:beta-glucoside-specific PTS transporter subunit IIABC n=1 Tax=Paenibacillus albidus TaxID=2041023 RepID=UPI001BEC75C8|nr:beta-glucoside-specific PTS transporter subunit IIABC [Paenibacillus albidus]MBT2287604.1 PTS glucose transporter subunit IIA [Paenibacillus albidus]